MEKQDDYPDAERLMLSINRLAPVVDSVYRINHIKESAAEFRETVNALNSDNVEALLTAERRFRSYTLEFDMFLDYWEAYISHHKTIDGIEDEELIKRYKQLFRDLTRNAYDNNIEYQLLDLIRNQTAHVQSPVNRIHVGLDDNEVYSDRDILLANCKNGENKKRILKAQPKEIALRHIVDVTEECLCDIHNQLICFQIDDSVIEESRVIERFIVYAFSKDLIFNPWLIMESPDDPHPYHIRDIKAYGYLCERVNKIADNSEGRR